MNFYYEMQRSLLLLGAKTVSWHLTESIWHW